MAEPTEAQDRSFMETKSAANHRKIPMRTRQLPITGFAHKAGVVGDARQAASVAVFDVTAERRRAAGRNRGHDATLAAADMPGVTLKIGVAMPAEDVGEFERRPLHEALLGRRHLQ
jgi:hypothetical protein